MARSSLPFPAPPPAGAAASEPPAGTAAAPADERAALARWLQRLVSRVSGVQTGIVLALDDSGALVPAALWPDAIADASELLAPAQRCVDERRELLLELPDGARGPGRHAIAAPVLTDGRVAAAVVLIAARGADDQWQRLQGELQWGLGWVEAWQRQRELKAQHTGLAQARQALDMLALLAGHERADDACVALATELARAGGCDRVALGLVRRGRVRLSALSHAATFEPRSALAATLEAAMAEAVEQRAPLTWPALGDRDRSLLVNAQQALAGGHAALTVPIVAGGRAVGAVCWQLPQALLTHEFIAQGEAMAVVLAPLLARLHDQSRWWAGRGPALLARATAALADRRRPGFAVLALLGGAGLLALALVETTYHVPARALLEGRLQRVIAAPYEGFVAEAPARAGQTVAKGALLARLDDRDLVLERARLRSESAQQQHKLDEALARHERAELALQAALQAETQARLAQVEERLVRTRITAPFDGVLVSGDLSQALGAPVEQGRTLFELAPLDGYRVVLKVDERDIRAVQPGQRGRLLLAGMAGESLPFTVRHVSVATAEEGRNLFRVEADLDRPEPSLRPGMEGVGKIAAGQRTWPWIWSHRALDWLRLTLWRTLP